MMEYPHIVYDGISEYPHTGYDWISTYTVVYDGISTCSYDGISTYCLWWDIHI